MKKKFIAILLASLFILLPVFASCTEGDAGDDDDDDDIIDGVSGDPNLTDKDWDGEVFVVLTGVDRSEGQAFNIVDLVASEDDDLSDPIRKAVFERNALIKQLYNAEIERRDETNFNAIANDTLAFGGDYNAYMLKVQGALTLSLTGVLLDYNAEVDYVNLNEEWWDTSTIDDLSVKNKAYFALGDINTVDDEATWCILFNKELREKYPALPNFYDKVREGDWTVENMKLWASKSIIDDNGSVGNKWDPNNPYQFGMFYQDEYATVLLQSSGVTPFIKEKNGNLKSNLNSLEMQNAIDAIREYAMLENSDSEKWALNINNISGYGGKDIWQDVSRGGFKANKALFCISHCGYVYLLRDMDTDFGILPIPKLSETQEEYGNTIQYGNATCYTIPYNTPDPSFSGFMIEAMGFYSSRTYSETDSLKVAFYETTLQRKGARDDESWDMLDLVFENRILDISIAMNTGKINDLIISSVISDSNSWATIVASNQSKIDGQIREDIAHLMKG